jgi:hypothetical protein
VSAVPKIADAHILGVKMENNLDSYKKLLLSRLQEAIRKFDTEDVNLAEDLTGAEYVALNRYVDSISAKIEEWEEELDG